MASHAGHACHSLSQALRRAAFIRGLESHDGTQSAVGSETARAQRAHDAHDIRGVDGRRTRARRGSHPQRHAGSRMRVGHPAFRRSAGDTRTQSARAGRALDAGRGKTGYETRQKQTEDARSHRTRDLFGFGSRFGSRECLADCKSPIAKAFDWRSGRDSNAVAAREFRWSREVAR